MARMSRWVGAHLVTEVDDRPEPGDLLALLDTLAAGQPAWMAEAACRSSDVAAEDFFPAKGDTAAVERAKAVCTGCPVLDDCRTYALAQPTNAVGVIGGMAGSDRRAARRAAA